MRALALLPMATDITGMKAARSIRSHRRIDSCRGEIPPGEVTLGQAILIYLTALRDMEARGEKDRFVGKTDCIF